MNKPIDNLATASDSVLLWRMADAEDCGLSMDLMSVGSIEHASSRQDFVLQLSQRQHLYAVVVATHPFQDEIRLLRQFLSRMSQSPPVVLVLTDCPYPMMGTEQDFHAVANLNDSFADLHASFGRTRRFAGRRQQQSSANDAPVFRQTGQRAMLQSGTSLRMRLARAARQKIVEISGETGTARRLLVRLLHQARGGNEQNCLTFYHGTDAVAANETIAHIVSVSEEPGTFVLRDPEQDQLRKIATAFGRLQTKYPAGKAQLVVVNEQPSEVLASSDSPDASIQVAPLRDHSENTSDMLAGIMSAYANQVSNLRIAIEPKSLPLLSKHHWPGNICQLNLVFASAILAGLESDNALANGESTEYEVVLTSANVADQIGAFQTDSGNSNALTRAELRVAYQSVCDRFAASPLQFTNPRKLLNACLLNNAGLVWRVAPTHVNESLLQSEASELTIRRAA